MELVYPRPIPSITADAIVEQEAFSEPGNAKRWLVTWTDNDANVTCSIKVEDVEAPSE